MRMLFNPAHEELSDGEVDRILRQAMPGRWAASTERGHLACVRAEPLRCVRLRHAASASSA